MTAGGLLFGLILKAMHWQRFQGPANVIIAVHEHDGRFKIKDGLITASCDALALGLGASVGRYGPALFMGASLGGLAGFLAMEDLAGHTLPVVADNSSMSLVGSVAESDFISAYRLAVEQERDGQEDRETASSGIG